MKHLDENNEFYFSHLLFASKIAMHLFLSGLFLMVHGIFPWWSVPEGFCLDSTCKKIQRWNDYSKRRQKK